jgi:hypothetical protein
MNSTAYLPSAATRLVVALAVLLPATAGAAEPIAPHPENPRYFLFRGRPAILITSREHYGAVLNRDFDHVPYRNELFARRFNLTRLFSGTYREVPGSFAARTIVETEAQLGGPRHMIAQNIANGGTKVKDPNPAVSLFNFHYATPPDVIALNAGLNRAIGDDETGFRGTGDLPYRSEAWDFMLAGGSTFSHLDYSFTVAHPDGSAPVKSPTPGGGGPAFRKQLTILRDFLSALDYVRMKPDRTVIKRGIPDKARAQTLVLPGRTYAIYLNGGTHADLVLDLPAGRFRAEWINPRTGTVDMSQDIDHKGGHTVLSSPSYDEDVALRIVART